MATATKRRKHVSTKPPTDIYKTVTDNIIAGLESASGNNWVRPWRSIASGPRNIATGNRYNGINVLQLAFAQLDKGYDSPWWGTLKQWNDKGGRIRKGEKSTYSVFYRSFTKDVVENGETVNKTLRVARANPLFNIAQIDGVETPITDAPVSPVERSADADAWISVTGAQIAYEGNRAFYYRPTDKISCPKFEHFHSAPGFYSTVAHELGHWTGHEKRLDRTFGAKFGDQQYAVEELVAELCSAFVCARLGIESEPRADHAEYLKNWLQVLRSDDHAIFTAAAAAQRACDFLFGETKSEEVAA